MTKLLINEICKSQGITLTELAERVGITKSTLSTKLTNGNLRLDGLERIAIALNVEVRDLIAPQKQENEITDECVCPYCGKSLSVCIGKR